MPHATRPRGSINEIKVIPRIRDEDLITPLTDQQEVVHAFPLNNHHKIGLSEQSAFREKVPRPHAFPDQVALKFGQAGHDRAHQLAAGGAEIEAKARLSEDANFLVVQIVERLDAVLCTAAPSAEL